jgi:iron transport multicopper oxidase
MLQSNNTEFRPPVPDSLLINEGENPDITFKPGKTYRVRILSYSAFTASMIHFGSHKMRVIQIDASYVEEQEVEQLRVAPAERYDVLLTAKPEDAGQNFPYLVSMDYNRDFAESAVWLTNKTGYLVTDPTKYNAGNDVVSAWQPFDDSTLVPYSRQPAFGPVTKTWILNYDNCFDANGIPR